MEEKHREFVFISDKELFTLLATLGVENWYGIQFEQKNEKYFYSNDVINSLYQKGYIELDKDTIKVSKELSLILSILISAKSFLYLRKPGVQNTVCSYYLSDAGAISIEKSLVEETTYKISNMDLESLKQTIMECFDTNIDQEEKTDKNNESIITTFNQEISEKEILQENYSAVIEKYKTEDGTKINRVVIQDAGLFYRLFVQDGTSDICMENSEEKQNYICKLLLET